MAAGDGREEDVEEWQWLEYVFARLNANVTTRMVIQGRILPHQMVNGAKNDRRCYIHLQNTVLIVGEIQRIMRIFTGTPRERTVPAKLRPDRCGANKDAMLI